MFVLNCGRSPAGKDCSAASRHCVSAIISGLKSFSKRKDHRLSGSHTNESFENSRIVGASFAATAQLHNVAGGEL